VTRTIIAASLAALAVGAPSALAVSAPPSTAPVFANTALRVQAFKPSFNGAVVGGGVEVRRVHPKVLAKGTVGLYRAKPGDRYAHLVQYTAFKLNATDNVVRTAAISRCVPSKVAGTYFTIAVTAYRIGTGPGRQVVTRSLARQIKCSA